MDQDGPGHGGRGPVLAAPGQVAPLAAVVLLLHQVIPAQVSQHRRHSHTDHLLPGSEGHEVRVVGGGGDGDGARAPHVGVAQLVGQLLELVSVEVVVIPEDVIVAGPRRALDT